MNDDVIAECGKFSLAYDQEAEEYFIYSRNQVVIDLSETDIDNLTALLNVPRKEEIDSTLSDFVLVQQKLCPTRPTDECIKTCQRENCIVTPEFEILNNFMAGRDY